MLNKIQKNPNHNYFYDFIQREGCHIFKLWVLLQPLTHQSTLPPNHIPSFSVNRIQSTPHWVQMNHKTKQIGFQNELQKKYDITLQSSFCYAEVASPSLLSPCADWSGWDLDCCDCCVGKKERNHKHLSSIFWIRCPLLLILFLKSLSFFILE